MQEETLQIPILMYHEISEDEHRYAVSPTRLHRHLDYLRARGYRLVTFAEYARQPHPGTAVVTFDDSTSGQFRILDDGSIDPNSAVGILEAYRFRHPAFPVRATFFVNAFNEQHETTFGQEGLEGWKLQQLVRRGYEVGAHGFLHHDYDALSGRELLTDLAQVHERLRLWIPGYTVQSFAYPYGSIPDERFQNMVSMVFPYTAHAWGGLAKGERLNAPRIEMNPTSLLVMPEQNIYKRLGVRAFHGRSHPQLPESPAQDE